MPNLYFPINARITNANKTVYMSGQFVSVSAGIALINMVVTNIGLSSIAGGNTLSFIPSQFTLMPTS